MEWFKKLIDKWTCKHEWEITAKSRYSYGGDRYMLICKKCGKIKTKWV